MLTKRERIASMLRSEPHLTHKVIAERLGITRQAVGYLINSAGGPVGHPAAMSFEQWENLKPKVMRARQRGFGWNAIARRVKMAPTTLWKYFNQGHPDERRMK